MRADLARLDYLRSVAQRLAAAPHGARQSIVDEAARQLQCSVPTVFRRLREVGWSSGRKLRADRGDSRISRDELLTIAALMGSGARANGKQITTLGDAISIARANGLLRSAVSESTVSRLLRREGLHWEQLRAPTPHVTMRSPHPNWCWQVDPSLCVVYYSRGQGVQVIDERKAYKNKPAELERLKPLRVWRYVLTDHCSGAVYVRYFEAAGESQATLAAFLLEAMEPSDPRVLMRGVPLHLVWDAGSANSAHGIQQMLTALQVVHWPHLPGNPRAKGQVECSNNLIERRLEGRLPFVRVPTVDELNAHARDWMVAYNATSVHGRHGHSRYAAWQMIRPDQLRLRPPLEACQALMTSKPETRKVRGDLTLSFSPRGHGPQTYSVAHLDDVRVGDVLDVCVNIYRAPEICVIRRDAEGHTRYLCIEPQQRDAFGFIASAPVIGESYAAARDTSIDTARKDANERALGVRDPREAQAARDKGALPFGGAIDPFKDVREAAAAAPSFLQRRGTELHLPNQMQVELPPMSRIQLLRALRDRLGRPATDAEMQRVAEWYPSVVETDLDDIVQRLTEQPREERPRLALVR